MNPHCRIRLVRMKNGSGEIRILTPFLAKDERFAKQRIKGVLDAHGSDIAGLAVMVWGADLRSTCYLGSGPRSAIPGALIPDFVRNRLLLERAVDWTLEVLKSR